MQPAYSDAYLNLAAIYKKQKDTNKELATLNKLISLEPSAYQAYFARGSYFYEKGNVSKAKEDFLKVISLKATHFGANYALAGNIFK